MWECLYLGVVPIVKRTPVLEHWFRELPILWVDSYDVVTPAFLLGVNVSYLWDITRPLNTDHLISLKSIEFAIRADIKHYHSYRAY
jgi:hypothetical protein